MGRVAWSPRSALALSCLLLLLSLPLLSHLSPSKTLPAIPPSDELSDLSLLRLAASQSPLPSPSSPPKLALLFLTTSPLFLSPLWDLFFSSQNSSLFSLYVHSSAALPALSGAFRSRLVPSKPAARNSPTLISAARRLLASALLDDPANAYFALLSPHCIPLRSFNSIYSFLFPPLKKSHRYPSYIEILSDEPELKSRYVAWGDSALLPEIPFEKFRVGSQFFVLSRRHAVLVVEDLKFWGKFRRPCLKSRQSSCYPEEHYFPTLLSELDLEGCTKNSLTNVNWKERNSGHPYTYSPEEITPELLRKLRVSDDGRHPFLFARKFSAECLRPLMEIAESVIFKD